MSKAGMTKRLVIFTDEDVAAHNTSSDCWISRNGKVYNVTSFLNDHPGGDDLILAYAGKDVGTVMKDPLEHEHSESAYDMLDEYVVGRLGAGEVTVSDDWEAPDDFHPDDTDQAKDFEKNEFLDLRRPLMRQMWEGNFSKSYYLQQVHQPRHLSEPARFFGPDWMEMFTRTVWYVVPLFWGPIAGYLFLRSLHQFNGPLPPALPSSLPFGPGSQKALLNAISNFLAPLDITLLAKVTSDAYAKTLACFALGCLIWTLLEYIFHRFLFHMDGILPDTPAFLTLHFLIHGVHHYLPMDRLRLVMPPLMFFVLQTPMTRLAYLIFPTAMANGVIAGSFTFYILYDCMHYALHHTKLPQYMREMKKYHLAHHYKNFDLGFGVTSKIWDVVFNTVLPMKSTL